MYKTCKVIDMLSLDTDQITKGKLNRRMIDEDPLIKEATIESNGNLTVEFYIDLKNETTDTKILEEWEITEYDEMGKPIKTITKKDYLHATQENQ